MSKKSHRSINNARTKANQRKATTAKRCDANRKRACDARKAHRQHKRSNVLPDLTHKASKLLQRIASGGKLVVNGDSWKCVGGKGATLKVKIGDVLALVNRGLVSLAGMLTLAGKALADHFGAVKRAVSEIVQPTPVRSVTDWNAFPLNASGKPAPYMALTNAGHLVIQQKRVLVAGNSLSDSEKLRLAAANIGTRTAVTI